MTTATIVPDDLLGFAEKTFGEIETGKIKQLTPTELSKYRRECELFRNMFVNAHQQIEAALRDGVDPKEFASKYDAAIGKLDAILVVVAKVVLTVQAGQQSPPEKEFIDMYNGLGLAVVSLREFMAKVVAAAKAPPHEIDWQKVEAAEAAYSRGDTKPFQRLGKRVTPK